MLIEKIDKIFRESAENFIEMTPYGVIIADEDGKYVYVNQNACDVTGYTKDEMIGMTIINILPEDMKEITVETFKKLKNTKKEYFETSFIAKGGIIKQWSIKAVYLDNGMTMGFVQDITERKEMQNELKKSEKRLIEAQRIAKVGNWEIDFKNKIYEWSDEIYEMFNINKEEFVINGKNVMELVYQNDRALVKDYYENMVKEPFYEIVYRVIVGKNKVKYIRNRGETYFNKEKEPIKAFGTIQDITESCEYEKALSENEKRFKKAQKIAKIGSWEIDFETNEIYWSDEVYSIFEVEKLLFNINYDAIMEKVYPEDIEIVKKEYFAKSVKEPFYEVVHRIVVEGNKIKYIRVKGETSFDKTGKPIKASGTIQDITVSKNIQNELEKREMQLKEAQRIAKIGSWEINFIKNKIKCSDEVYKIYEIEKTAEENDLKKFTAVMHPDDRERVNIAYSESIKRKEPFEIVHRLLMKDGRIKYVEERCETYFYDNENEGISIGTVQDITNSIKVQNELIESEKRLKEAQRIGKLGSWEVNHKEKAYIWSDELYDIFGLNKESNKISYEKLGQMSSDKNKDIDREFREKILAERNYDMEYRVTLKNGKTKVLKIIGETYFDEEGNPERSYGTTQDITDSKEIQNELIESERQLKEAQRIAKIGNWNLDHVTLKSIWSDEIYDIFEVNKDEFKINHETVIEATYPEDIEKMENYMRKVAKEPCYEIEYRIKTGKNKIKYVKNQGETYFDSENKPTKSMGTIQDITESKKLEEMLIKAKEDAEGASKAKSQFLANMSHEIRTPMNGIIGMGELLSLTELNKEQKGYVEALQFSADNLLGIINDILDISKIEAGKLDIEIKDCNVEEMAEHVLEVTSFSAQKKNIELLLKSDKNIPEYLETDEGKCRQILLNLVNNAIKFSENGSILVEIKKGRDIDEYTEIEFSVTDEGVGISEEIQKSLFQPFVQGDISYTKKYQGTGLGLAISKNLVEMMGGTILFETKLGIGTRFYFSIPMKISEKYTHNIRKMEFNLKNMPILFIDDNEINRKITEEMLKDAGAVVYLADSGYRGIEMLENGLKVNLILLDVHMPVLDGFETAQIIKEKFGEKYQIVMFSSVDIRNNGEKIRDVGAADYLVKPIKRVELFDKIKQIINTKYEDEIEKELKEMNKMEEEKKEYVMIVEDNEVNMNVLEKLLNSMGINNIVKAQNGKEGVELYKKYKTKLIFMDLQMPVMNGFEAFKEIIKEADKNRENRPFVSAITAYAMESDRKECMREGMDYFISKPFKIEVLKKCIEEFEKNR